MFDQQIVITGVGLVSALGNTPLSLWDSLCAGASAAAPVDAFSTAPFYNVHSSSVREFIPPVARKHKQPWTSSSAVQFAMAAAHDALGSACLLHQEALRSQAGVVFGSTLACMELMVQLDQDAIVNGARTVDPMLFPDIGASAPSCRVSQQFGLQGFNSILANGQTASLDAIHYGALLVADGLVPVVLVGGVEELTRSSFLYHAHTLRVSRHGDEDDTDTGTDLMGMLLGEGSAALTLETKEHADGRGARVIAELLGFGTSFCAQGPRSAQAIDSASESMRLAIAQAGLEPSQIKLIFSSASGDFVADRIEAAAIEQVVPGVPVLALKRALGELNSTAGAMQAVLAATLVSESRLQKSAYRIPPENSDLYAGPMNRAASLPDVCLVNNFSSSDSASSFSSLVVAVPE